MKHGLLTASAALLLLVTTACGDGTPDEGTSPATSGEFEKNPYPSTYKPYPSTPVLLKDATVYDGIGGVFDGHDVLLLDGNIAEIAADIEANDGVQVVDARGKFVTPGIIDNHSHLGVYPSPGVSAHSDGNEISGPVTAEVWAEHGAWPQDPGFVRALAGGVTSMQILPGSANLFGGRGVTVKNVLSRTVQGMKFPDAP